MRKLLTPFYYIQGLILKLMIKMFLPNHKFKVGDLVFKDGTRTLYEVDSNYYNTDLNPVVIVRAYPVGTQVFGIDRFDILEFMLYRKKNVAPDNPTMSDVGTTAHDNFNFAKKGKFQ